MIDGRIDLKKVCLLLLAATAIALVVHLVTLDAFNKREHHVYGNDDTSASYMDIDARKDKTSTWKKRDYDLYGKTVDITGATIDGELHNTSSDTIGDWTLRINIKGDCLINQSWNGEVEIHQNVGTAKEVVQRMNLQNYELDDVKLEYLYDGDMLIPLKAGDYVIYYPNEKFKEVPLAANDSVKIGVIFYYLDSIDLSDYTLTFKYDRAITQGPTFLVFAVLAVMCFIFALTYFASDIAYKRAQNEMELRKSGLSWLSDMYAAIYLVDLSSGDMTPISEKGRDEHSRPWRAGAREFLNSIIGDADDAYADVVSEFADFDSLAGRMAERDSIVCEFISKTYGWSSMRFFAMDRVGGQPPKMIICTVQDINEEKGELDRIEEQVHRAENEAKARYAFMVDVSQEVREPLTSMVKAGERIAAESGEESVRELAREMCAEGEDLLAFVGGMLDYSKLEVGGVSLLPVDYSLKELLAGVAGRAQSMTAERGIAFEMDIETELPSVLHGDAERLEEVMYAVVASQADAIEEGIVKLSVFGKSMGDKAHLLISVRAVEEGAAAALGQARAGANEHARVRMNLAAGLLGLMGSEFREVQSDDGWHECYFEIEQGVVDASPVGEILVEGARS